MEFAFGQLRWSPEVFWNCTLREFNAAIKGVTKQHAPQAPSRAKLKELMERYPDGPSKN